jgi:hypothetical protein
MPLTKTFKREIYKRLIGYEHPEHLDRAGRWIDNKAGEILPALNFNLAWIFLVSFNKGKSDFRIDHNTVYLPISEDKKEFALYHHDTSEASLTAAIWYCLLQADGFDVIGELENASQHG